jgi:hypothetical protein
MRENLTAWDNDPKWQCLAAVVAKKRGISVTCNLFKKNYSSKI